MMDHISWKSQWQIDKFDDPLGVIAKALQNGLSTEEATNLWSKEYLGNEVLRTT
jgi:hypothetical protein